MIKSPKKSSNTNLSYALSKHLDDDSEYPEFPWDHAYAVLNTTLFQNIW